MNHHITLPPSGRIFAPPSFHHSIPLDTQLG